MKKFLAITLALVFVLSMATVSFAALSSENYTYEWKSGFLDNVLAHKNMKTSPNVIKMTEKVAAGSIMVTLNQNATSASAGDHRGAVTTESGFYFKAEIDQAPVMNSNGMVESFDVDSAYLLTLHNETHVVTLYSVANSVETVLKTADLDTLIDGLVDAETVTGKTDVGPITLKADFTADGKVVVYAGAGAEASTKAIEYTPEESAAALEGTDVVLMGRGLGSWATADTSGDAFAFDAYSAEAGNPEMGDTTAIVAVVAIVALLGCGVAFTASKKRI